MVDKLPTSTGERRISEPPTDPKHQKEVEADRFFFKKENGKKIAHYFDDSTLKMLLWDSNLKQWMLI